MRHSQGDMFQMEPLISTPFQNLLLSQCAPSQSLARSPNLEPFLILLLLSHSISNPLANPGALPSKLFQNPTTSQRLYGYIVVQATFILLLDYCICLPIGVPSSTLLPHRRCYWHSQSGPLKSLSSIVRQSFPQLL